MQQIQDRNLAQLLMQLHFTPSAKQRKQLDAAEQLLKIIKPELEYPFEFVCFKITSFHLKGFEDQSLIKGEQLVDDLKIFISKLSDQVAPPVAVQTEKVYTIDKLAQKLGVSTKTIHRWRRNKDLIAKKFLFEDGKKRFAFLQSSVDNFINLHPKLTSKAKGFSRLTEKEKTQIVKEASQLASATKLSRYQIVERIAKNLNKSHETVRYILIKHEKSEVDKSIFEKPSGVITPTQAIEIYKLYKQGYSVIELQNRFFRNKSSIYRIIQQRRAKELVSRKIEFVTSDEFPEDGAKEKILTEDSFPATTSVQENKSLEFVSRNLGEYLQATEKAVTLNREQEVELFRRYNYLKYLACIEKTDIKPNLISSKSMKRIEDYLSEAEQIKNLIIEANLRLVVSIARKHMAFGGGLPDLVSEGNFSLMRAVEKFDYTRGFRFATYASWAITKDYARKIPAEAARLNKTTTASMEDIDKDLRAVETAGVAAVERARTSLVQVIKNDLSEREQYVILNHFGLPGALVKKKKKTLKQIGEDLEVSKERVRQIELIALQKLRHSLSTKEFELLTG